jgi:SAM-dependent methyltransferase
VRRVMNSIRRGYSLLPNRDLHLEVMMMNSSGIGQPDDFINRMLPLLADPITHEPLDPLYQGGEVVGLSSASGDVYRVENNIPRLMPNPDKIPLRRRQLSLWKRLQEVEWAAYRVSPVGVFSVDGNDTAAEVGKIITKAKVAACLDVGCGVLPFPAYMKESPDVTFYGIDPFLGDINRSFPFVQGLGDYLPFRNETFESILYASTIDHMIEPDLSLRDACRVLAEDGVLFIWFTPRKRDLRYFKWKVLRCLVPSQYNKHHQWAFRVNSLVSMLTGNGYRVSDVITLRPSSDTVLISTKKAIR